jgi:hypothetical protein
VSLQGRTTEDSEVAGKGDREFSDGVLHRCTDNALMEKF